MELTKEGIAKLYNRCREVCLAKHNVDPDSIELNDDGTITAVTEDYCCGSSDYDYFEILAEDLSSDLDKIVEERKERERKEKEEEEKRRAERERQREIREKAKRKGEYLKLKKEFEND